MATSKKILILGNFGYESNNIGGQTIKTRNILDLLRSKTGSGEVDYFDIDSLYVNKFNFLHMFKAFTKADVILLVPGQKFLNVIFPLLYGINKIFKKDIHLFAVGGWLSDFISGKAKLAYKLKNINVFVESVSLKRDLIEKNNLRKVSVFPNFRFHDFEPKPYESDSTFKLLFFARITKAKGYDTLFDFARYYANNRSLFNREIKIDFYGPLDPEYERDFLEKAALLDIVSYNGVVSPKEVFGIISKYDLTVLPTVHPGEGFPGTIVDSYIAGVPVVVTRWKNLPEYVDEDITGYIYNVGDNSRLYEIIRDLVNNPVKLAVLKKQSHNKSIEYSAEKAWEIIRTLI